MNFWPFKKKPAVPKPRLMRFERSDAKNGPWRCGVALEWFHYAPGMVGMKCEQPMGEGHTPRAAYADWQRRRETA